MDQLSYEQNMAELDNEMVKQETNLYNLGLIEARNIAANQELQDLSRKMNKKISIPGSEIFLPHPKEENKETKVKSSKKSRKKAKKQQSVNEIAEDFSENNTSPSNKISNAKISKVVILKPNTKTQGTNVPKIYLKTNIYFFF